MIVKVEMLAFMNGEIREVNVPDDEIQNDNILDLVFKYGQNEFQPVSDRCSVSVGDVILLGNDRWMVAMVGFNKLPENDYQEYKIGLFC